MRKTQKLPLKNSIWRAYKTSDFHKYSQSWLQCYKCKRNVWFGFYWVLSLFPKYWDSELDSRWEVWAFSTYSLSLYFFLPAFPVYLPRSLLQQPFYSYKSWAKWQIQAFFKTSFLSLFLVFLNLKYIFVMRRVKEGVSQLINRFEVHGKCFLSQH